MNILSKKHHLAHLHKEDDVILLVQLSKVGLKVIANHCMHVLREDVFSYLHSNNIPIIYGLLVSSPYKS
ncbi:MAG TPA: hypothetical protein VN704_08535 [Verrucomicrobiae bacterium]|nr:hypothetical protein [Verrucomicrobiae bacterium]